MGLSRTVLGRPDFKPTWFNMVQPFFLDHFIPLNPKFPKINKFMYIFLGQISAFFWFKWVSTSKKTGRSYERLATRDQPVIYPWSTRDNFQIPRVHKIKPYVSRTNLGFPQPVINPWSTRDLPVCTRVLKHGFGPSRLTQNWTTILMDFTHFRSFGIAQDGWNSIALPNSSGCVEGIHV